MKRLYLTLATALLAYLSWAYVPLLWGAFLGAQQQPPVAYQPQLISYPSTPFGTCQIYQAALNVSNGAYYLCNPSTNSWVASGSINSIGVSINVKGVPYNAVGDTSYANLVSISRTASTLTLPVGSTATVGQLIQCTSPSFGSEVVPYGPNNGGQLLPAKITAVSGQIVTYNTTPVGAGGVLNDGQCVWGHDDTVAVKGAYQTCLALAGIQSFQGGPAQTYPCNVYLPKGGYMISATPFDASTISQNAMGVGIYGDGNNQSIMYGVIGYSNTAPANCGYFICGFGWGQKYADFGVDGIMSLNSGGLGIGFANNDLITLNCGKCLFENIHLVNWYGFTGRYMLQIAGGAELHYPRIENPFGGAGSMRAVLCNACSSDIYDPFFSNTTQNLQVTSVLGRGSGEYLNVHGGIIDEGAIPSVAGSKAVAFFGVTLMGGANCLSVDATSEVRISGGYCGSFNGNPGGGGPTVASGGKLWLADVEVSANGAGQYCYNAGALGGIIDLGGNSCILAGGATTYNAGSANTQFTLTTQAQTQLGSQQVVNGVVPTGCTITGNGTSTCAFDTGSTDAAGRITITAAGTTTAVGLVSFSFATTYGTNSTNCSANYLSGTGTWAIGAIAPIFITNTTAGVSFNINNAGTNLTATSTYKVNYTCYGQ